jgi:hypothetical protein
MLVSAWIRVPNTPKLLAALSFGIMWTQDSIYLMDVNVFESALPQLGSCVGLIFFIMKHDSVLGVLLPFEQGQNRDAPSLLVLSIVPSGK